MEAVGFATLLRASIVPKEVWIELDWCACVLARAMVCAKRYEVDLLVSLYPCTLSELQGTRVAQNKAQSTKASRPETFSLCGSCYTMYENRLRLEPFDNLSLLLDALDCTDHSRFHL
jgi:hypothetical protein